MKKWPIITGIAALAGACTGALLFARKKLQNKPIAEEWEDENDPAANEPEQILQEADMLPDEDEGEAE